MKTADSNILKALQAASLLLFLLMLPLFAYSRNNPGPNSLDNTIKLNPECKLKRMSNGSVIISTKNQEGVEEKHQFTDFYADLLLAAFRKQQTEYILTTFSRKYYLSRDECRREIKHALNVLAQWNIVERDDRLADH